MAEDKLLFVGQKALIEKDGKVLILIDSKKRLDFPGGKIQITDTSADQALLREIQEEIQLDVVIGRPYTRMFFTNHYVDNRPDDGIYIIVFLAKYHNGEVILSDEHDSFHWVDKESYKKYKEFDEDLDFYPILEAYFSEEKS